MSLNVGTLSADLRLDDDPFNRSLERAHQTGENRATRLGSAMTKKVTLPLVAAGGAAVKLGVDFETSMSRIQGLVGLSADEVDNLRSGVMDLAGETAKSPQELSEALFTVTSAGFRGAEAMGVLEQAAKASAAGLGETRQIAEALTGAVNAYGPEVLDAADATDILVATARAGNFETDQLAGSLGRVTPFAKQAGASFEDVGGSIALLTRVNNNATESITQVTALMRAFVVPTQEAKTVLGHLGMEAQDVRDMIGEQGLVATLQMLDDKLGGNREQLGRLLGSSEAASAAFQILEADADTLEGTFGTVADAAGLTDEAFGAAAETSGFELKQALADLQAALVEAGDTIAPFVATVAGGLATVAEAFSGLPGPVQNLVIALAGLMAAAGPVMTIGGKIAAGWAAISVALDKVAVSAYNASGALRATAASGGAVLAAIGAATVAVVRFRDEMSAAEDRATGWAENFAGDFDASKASVDEVNAEVRRLIDARDKMQSKGDQAWNGFKKKQYYEAAAALDDHVQRLDAVRQKANELIETEGMSAEAALRAATSTDVLSAATDNATGEFDTAAAALEAEEQAASDVADSFRDLSDALRAQFDPMFALQDAAGNLHDAQAAAAQAAAEHGENSDEAREANREATRAAVDYEASLGELRAEIEEGNVKLSDAADQLDDWVAAGVLTEDQARQAKEEMYDMAVQASELDGQEPTVRVNAETGEAEYKISRVARDRDVWINVRQRGVDPGEVLGHFGARGTRASGGPVQAGGSYLVGEQGPEIVRFGSSGMVYNAGQTQQMLGDGRAGMAGLPTTPIVVESTIELDGRKVGASRSVIEGQDGARSRSARNTGGR